MVFYEKNKAILFRAKREGFMKDEDAPIVPVEQIEKTILEGKFNFGDSIYECDNENPVSGDNLKVHSLGNYLNERYKAGSKPSRYYKIILDILGNSGSSELLKKNKSDLFKVITLFSILSKVKNGWYNVLISIPKDIQQSSLENIYTNIVTTDSKNLSDLMISCFFKSLASGINPDSENKIIKLIRASNSIEPQDYLKILDLHIFNLINIISDHYSGFDGEECRGAFSLEVSRDLAVHITTWYIDEILKDTNQYADLSSDCLRTSLVKSALFNLSINQLNRHSELYQEVYSDALLILNKLQRLKDEIELIFLNCNSFNECQVVEVLERLYENECDKPKGLSRLVNKGIPLAKIIIQLYDAKQVNVREIYVGAQYRNNGLINPINVAISALLVLEIQSMNKELNINVLGENNGNIKIYREILKHSNSSINERNIDDLIRGVGVNKSVDIDLFQTVHMYLTELYSVSLSCFNESENMKATLAKEIRYKKSKHELIVNTYRKLNQYGINEILILARNLHKLIEIINEKGFSEVEAKIPMPYNLETPDCQ